MNIEATVDMFWEIVGYFFDFCGAIANGIITGICNNPIVLVIFIPAGLYIIIKAIIRGH